MLTCNLLPKIHTIHHVIATLKSPGYSFHIQFRKSENINFKIPFHCCDFFVDEQ